MNNQDTIVHRPRPSRHGSQSTACHIANMTFTETTTIEVGFPVHDVVVVRDCVVAVGGGGPGNHNIPNRIKYLSVCHADHLLRSFAHIDLPPRRLPDWTTEGEEALRASTASTSASSPTGCLLAVTLPSRCIVYTTRSPYHITSVREHSQCIARELFIPLQDNNTELKFSVFSPAGDFLVMGTNRGALVCFRHNADGSVDLQDTLTDPVIHNEINDAAFSPSGKYMAFISNRHVNFVRMSDARSTGESVCSSISHECSLSAPARCELAYTRSSIVQVSSMCLGNGRCIGCEYHEYGAEQYEDAIACKHISGAYWARELLITNISQFDGNTALLDRVAGLFAGPCTAFGVTSDGRLMGCADDDGGITLFRCERAALCMH
mgnify:CR=1 FL=1